MRLNAITGIRLPDKLIQEIDKASKKLHRSRSFLIREAIENFLYELNEAEEAWERWNDPHREFISGKELRKILGL